MELRLSTMERIEDLFGVRVEDHGKHGGLTWSWG